MPYRELSEKEIENWFGLKRDEMPTYVVLSARWPWDNDTELRRYIKEPRYLGKKELGNLWVDNVTSQKIGYMSVYGSGMTADMLFILIKLGVKYIFQIGSMGSLQEHVNLYDLIIPSECTKFEGLDHHFSQNTSKCDDFLLNIVKRTIKEKDYTDFHVGKTISIDFIFAETQARVKKWSEQGLLAIDMETATTYAMCNELGIRAIALLFVIDNLVKKGELLSNKAYLKNDRGTKIRMFIRDVIFETITKIDNKTY